MSEGYRVLVSCPLAWDGLEEFEPAFQANGISIDLPEIPGQELGAEELLPIIGQYHGILAGDDHLSREVIEAGSRLKVIAKWGVGTDAIDLDAARENGVVVLNTPGMFGDELADYAVGFLILLARGQHIVDREVRAGGWHKLRGRSLAGRKLGIVGLGSSGAALARRALAMEMEVLGVDPLVEAERLPPEVKRVELADLLAVSDVISLHVPVVADTRSMIDAGAIARMKHGVWLINTSRGALIDESALLDGLESGVIGAAALDVFGQEPPDPSNPLLHHPNVVLGAHNGSNTTEAVARTTRAAVANLIEGLTGETTWTSQ
ncbi:MAG TPA: phosphoglycerate dehydrogenase [Acidimicrobiia bacterium]|nr:phosphoglycerate dehydrogenase [Acidimicrobiia bacterium]